MTHQQLANLINNQKDLYSVDVNGKIISNTDFLTILIKRLEKINYQEWIEKSVIQSHVDIRFQLFAKIEMAVVHYIQSIISTLNGIELIWETTKSLGYEDEFVANSFVFREVSLRTSFIEKVFFEIDYFIQRMNKHINFHTSGSIHKKQQLFAQLMNTLGIGNIKINTDKIVDDLNSDISDISTNYMATLFTKAKSRNIQMSEIYTYLVSMRNSFHNNGYSQIDLNKINIGGVNIEIKKGDQINQGHDVVCIIVYMIIYPLLKIVEETFAKHPKQYWKDPYTQEIKDFLEKNK